MIKLSLFLGILFMLTSCSNLNSNRDNPDNKLDIFINNHQSMTQSLKELNHTFKVKVIYNRPESGFYTRLVSLELNNVPVVVAISSTKLNNQTFVRILFNANTNSIGDQLFAKHSKIKRNNNMQINNILISSIANKEITNYLNSIGYQTTDIITERISSFYYKNEDMQLIEYILPKIKYFLHS